MSCFAKIATAILIYLLALSSTHARYTNIAVTAFASGSNANSMFCGLREDGHVECFHQSFREPSVINGNPALTYSDIGVGRGYACGITTAQDVACWGDAIEAVLSVPTFEFPVIDLSVAPYFACAVDNDTNVKCWGHGDSAETQPPGDQRGFIDVAINSRRSACGLKSDGTVVCWGDVDDAVIEPSLPIGINDLTRISANGRYGENLRFCGIRSDGNVMCWFPGGATIAQLNTGPYREVYQVESLAKSHVCAITFSSEVHCAEVDRTPTETSEGSGEGFFTIETFTDTYEAITLWGSRLCGITTYNRLQCFDDGAAAEPVLSESYQELIDIINGELEMPPMVLTDAQHYGFGVEVFFESSELLPTQFSNKYDVQIFRDGELLTTTDNGSSYIDRTIAPSQAYDYAVRALHFHGQTGELSNTISVTSTNTISQAPARPQPVKGLRADVYWFDIELFWDRDMSGEVRNYEIRRNGLSVGTTRGTSWYDNSTVEGEQYYYDVIAVAHDDVMLGISSVPVLIGDRQCI